MQMYIMLNATIKACIREYYVISLLQCGAHTQTGHIYIFIQQVEKKQSCHHVTRSFKKEMLLEWN